MNSEQSTVNSTDGADSTTMDEPADGGQLTEDATDETPATDDTQPVDNL